MIQQEEAPVVEVEQVPVTTEAPPPPPEAPKVPVLSDMIEVVDDDIVVDTDLFISLEDDVDMGVEIMDYVAEVAEETIEEAPIPYTLVEEKPSFMGGDANEFTKWVYSKIVYPEVARENGISGRVTLQFTIESDGSLTNIKVLRGIDQSLDQEAVRVVSMSPKWTPGNRETKLSELPTPSLSCSSLETKLVQQKLDEAVPERVQPHFLRIYEQRRSSI